MSFPFPVVLCVLAVLAPGLVWAQVLRDAESGTSAENAPVPLVVRDAQSEPAPGVQSSAPLVLREAATTKQEPQQDVADAIARLRQELQAVVQADISAAQKQEKLDRLVADNPMIFSVDGAGYDAEPRSIESVIEMLERMVYEEAAFVAPNQQVREQVYRNTPAYIDPLESDSLPLIAPRSLRSKIVVTREAEANAPAGYIPWWLAAAARERQQMNDLPESAGSPERAAPENDDAEPVQVAFLADKEVTEEMHDDTTVLRDVENKQGDLVLFDALHLWVGGAVQYDALYREDLFDANGGGGSRTDTAVRRGEVIVRSTLSANDEVKLQYDLEDEFWRDVYWRWVSEEASRIVTVGNQKEPMGLDYQMGNKFGSAMERSAPATAFGSFRGKGVRLNEWFQLDADESFFSLSGDQPRIVTATLGVFTEGIESTVSTDVALTGRMTMGQKLGDGSAYHLGVSGTLREGEYDSINPRPEVQESDRLKLADFDADNQIAVGFEGMYTRGSLHAQAELTYSDYRGGDENAIGWGGYVQAGWFLTGETREYRPRWGLWAPLKQKGENSFEVFSRFSFTSGDADDDTRNDLGVLTLGGNWYRGKFRISLNTLYSATKRDINDQSTGVAVTSRIQLLL